MRVFLLGLALIISILPTLSETLSGSVSKTIAPVSIPDFKKGQPFTADMLPRQHTSKGWYEIPGWLAGTWRRESESMEGIFGPVQMKSVRERKWGHQLDAIGRIWQMHDEPTNLQVDTAKVIDYKIIRAMNPSYLSQNMATFDCISTDISVSKKSGKITDVHNQLDIVCFVPGASSTLKVTRQSCLCGIDGRPTTSPYPVASSTETQIAGFAPTDFDDGKDYKQDFIDYLNYMQQPSAIPHQ